MEIVASVAIEPDYFAQSECARRLYEEHVDWLLGYCRRHQVERADAEDAVQTTFLYALRALRRGVVPECERAWLTTIARNVCHSQRRTRQRRTEDAAELDCIALAQPDLDEASFVDDVRAALAALPATQRRALVLREWQGVPSNEIAAVLQLSEQATYALLSRARRSLARALSTSRRPLAGLNVAALVEHLGASLKSVLGGAAMKAAVATTAASVVVGGVVIEQRAENGAPPPARPTTVAGVEPGRDALLGAKDRTTPRSAIRDRGLVTERAVEPARNDGSVTRVAHPPTTVSAAPTTLAPTPEAEVPRQPSPPAPEPAPPAEPPAPAPFEPPPIPGDSPPIDLPPPIEELVPPVEELPLPPVPPAPDLPQLALGEA
jgi:RNA polymerase sigma-70 factor, ECF subfamily